MIKRSHTIFSLLMLMSISGGASFTGCARLQQPQLSEADKALLERPLVLDVFSARGFLGGSDYERYALNDDVLWRECGSVGNPNKRRQAKAIEGDDVLLNDPNLIVRERRVELLDTQSLLALKKSAQELLENSQKQPESDNDKYWKEKSTIPRPGSVFSLRGPGLFEISVQFGEKKNHIVTSIDAVAEAQESTLGRTNELFAAIRGVGPLLCNSRTFFGVHRKSPDKS